MTHDPLCLVIWREGARITHCHNPRPGHTVHRFPRWDGHGEHTTHTPPRQENTPTPVPASPPDPVG